MFGKKLLSRRKPFEPIDRSFTIANRLKLHGRHVLWGAMGWMKTFGNKLFELVDRSFMVASVNGLETMFKRAKR
jgi:hypothetical protein